MASSRDVDHEEPKTTPNSPQGNSVSKGKRNADESQGQNSPIRRSKRLKSGEALHSLPRATQPESTVKQENGLSQSPRSSGSRKTREKTGVTSLKREVKEEEEETEFSVNIKLNQKDQLNQEQPDGETATVTGKVSRKRKTKEEKELEMQPLAARATGLRMYVGAHVSAAKGIFNSINNSAHVGGNAFALFLKSQRKWDNPALQDDHRDQFRHRCLEHNYDASKHVLPHGSYLVNLAQEDKAKAKQAYNSFLDDLRRCEALGITLYNFHPGSANQTSFPSALSRLAGALTNALNATTTVVPVLETMCGHGTTIGGSLSEFRDILDQIPEEHHSRIGICVDTCHSFSAGYDLVSPEGFQAFMKEFDEVIGLKYLRALHLNDSKAPRGSKRDLHANIGTGFLGLRAFHNVMNEPRLEGLPMILETPIDRPVGESKSKSKTGATNGGGNGEVDDDGCESCDERESQQKGKKKAKKPAAAKQATVPDPSVWAREIKLLESLIGMDPEGEEFRRLETELAEEGREMREKHQEQYERKLAAEEKKKSKDAEKGQKTLKDMFKGSGKNGNKKRADDSGSDEDV